MKSTCHILQSPLVSLQSSTLKSLFVCLFQGFPWAQFTTYLFRLSQLLPLCILPLLLVGFWVFFFFSGYLLKIMLNFWFSYVIRFFFFSLFFWVFLSMVMFNFFSSAFIILIFYVLNIIFEMLISLYVLGILKITFEI